MDAKKIAQKIDRAAEAAKRVVTKVTAKVDETQRTAEELADAALMDAQSGLSRREERRTPADRGSP
jgi:hypothetical protein